jgi:hypothetical protein
MRRATLVVLAACGHAAPATPAQPTPMSAKPARAARADAAANDVCADPEGELALPDGEVATIDGPGVVRALDGHRGELRRCYERYLKQGARAGSVIAIFAVRGDGKVSQIQIHGFAESLDRCLCSVVAHTQFPPPRATAIVSFPMEFSGSL